MRRLTLCILLLGSACFVEASGMGTTAANFLKLGIGPRAVAMGEAQVGLADDVYASYWNPAGLAGLPVQEAGFVQNQYVEDINEQYLSYAYPHPSFGTLAGSLTYLHVEKFQGYDAVGQPTGNIGAHDAALTFSYARRYFHDRRMGSGLSLGMTGKYIQETLDAVSASSYAGDLGVLFDPGVKWGKVFDGWRAGMAVRNLGQAMTFDQETFKLPRSLNAGLSYTGLWRDEAITLVLDGRQPQDGKRSMGGGVELRTLQVVMVRAGYTSEGELGNGLRLGGGLKFKTVQIDYAYAGAGDFGAVHRIGLTLRLGKSPEDPHYMAQRWHEKGLRDYRRRRFTEALVEFNKALEIDPSHPDALNMMKKTYEEIKTMVPE